MIVEWLKYRASSCGDNIQYLLLIDRKILHQCVKNKKWRQNYIFDYLPYFVVLIWFHNYLLCFGPITLLPLINVVFYIKFKQMIVLVYVWFCGNKLKWFWKNWFYLKVSWVKVIYVLIHPCKSKFTIKSNIKVTWSLKLLIFNFKLKLSFKLILIIQTCQNQSYTSSQINVKTVSKYNV